MKNLDWRIALFYGSDPGPAIQRYIDPTPYGCRIIRYCASLTDAQEQFTKIYKNHIQHLYASVGLPPPLARPGRTSAEYGLPPSAAIQALRESLPYPTSAHLPTEVIRRQGRDPREYAYGRLPLAQKSPYLAILQDYLDGRAQDRLIGVLAITGSYQGWQLAEAPLQARYRRLYPTYRLGEATGDYSALPPIRPSFPPRPYCDKFAICFMRRKGYPLYAPGKDRDATPRFEAALHYPDAETARDAIHALGLPNAAPVSRSGYGELQKALQYI